MVEVEVLTTDLESEIVWSGQHFLASTFQEIVAISAGIFGKSVRFPSLASVSAICGGLLSSHEQEEDKTTMF